MKVLWSILMEKLKQIEPNHAALGIGLTGLFIIMMTTRIIIGLFNMIIDIVLAFTGNPLG